MFTSLTKWLGERAAKVIKKEKARQLNRIKKLREKEPSNPNLLGVQLGIYDNSHYSSYRVTTGMVVRYESQFDSAAACLETIRFINLTVESRGKFTDVDFKKKYSRDLHETYLDTWLVGPPNQTPLTIVEFHNALKDELDKLITNLNHLRAHGGKYTSYYTRYLSRLFDEIDRWLLVAELIGDPHAIEKVRQT